MRIFMQVDGGMCLHFTHACSCKWSQLAHRTRQTTSFIFSRTEYSRRNSFIPGQLLHCLTPAANRCYFERRLLCLPKTDNFRRIPDAC